MDELRVYDHIFRPDFRDIPRHADYTGIIVEPREHEHLDIVLRNFAYMMPNWSLTIFHSQDNEEFVKSILGSNHQVNMVKFTEGNITIDDYNELLMSPSLYNATLAKKIIVFQCDSFIRKKTLDPKFLSYDWVGAPCGSAMNVNGNVIQPYNGGLSLRSKESMLSIIKDNGGLKQQLAGMGGVMGNEDIFFSIGASLSGCKIAPIDDAISFSVESIYHHDSFGWHKAYKFIQPSLWSALKSINLSNEDQIITPG